MPTTAAGPFLLIDAQPADVAILEAAIAAIEFPWDAFGDFEGDTDGGIVVEFTTEGPNTASGLYYSGTNRIVLRPDLEPSDAFVFAHEVGHAIDDHVLDDDARAQLLELMHPGRTFGHIDRHDHPDVAHEERWANGATSYTARPNEAWADVFVATYAPRIWHGDEAQGWRQHWPRFLHWTEDTAAVRAIIDQLTTPPAPPAPEEEPAPMALRDVTGTGRRARAIRRAVRLGLMDPVKPGLFRPGRRVRRGELAEALVRTYDKARRQ